MKAIRCLSAVGILVLLHAAMSCDSSLGADPRPNVLMIVVDDMNDWVGCLGGHSQIRTPNIDRLAQRGILFANAHAPAPVCNPSRVSVLTGRSPASTGIYGNDIVWHEAIPDITSLPGHFKDNGYHVVGGGKVNHHMPGFNRSSDWHEYFAQVFDSHYQDQLARGLDVSRFQWPQGFPLNGLGSVRTLSKPPKNPLEFDWGPWSQGDLEMGDGRMVAWAVDFLQQPNDQPFFLAAGIYRPHLPFYAPSKYFEQYPEGNVQLPIVNPDDREDLPESGLKMAQDRGEDFELVVREGKHRELVQAYLANVAYADALVGHLLDALDASAHADNTMIVFWSDHGWHLGEKQHLHKFTLWERSTRVPLIVALPKNARGKVPSQGGSRCNQPVSLVDLFPTLIELCDLPNVDGLDGINLVPWIRKPDQERLQPAMTTHGFGNHAIRSEHMRYISYADGGEELYDHRSDPNEWHNLASDPAYAKSKQDLRGWLPKEGGTPRKAKKKNQPGRLPPIPDPLGVAGPIAGTDGSSLLVAGGANFPDAPPWRGGKKLWHDRIYVLHEPDGKWHDAGNLARPIGYAVSISIPDGLGVGPGVATFGGSDADRHYAEGWLLRWRDGRLEQTALPPMPRPCAQGCGALMCNTIYIAGGIESPDATVAMRQFWALDLDQKPLAWKELEAWPGPARMLAVAAVQDGAFYLCSGVELSAGADGKPVRKYLQDAYRYEPTGGWSRIADLPRAAAAAPSPAPAADPAGFLILGGDDGSRIDFRPLDQHPGFPRSILAYDARRDAWDDSGEQPVSHVTTSVVFWRNQYVIPSGEVRPGVRSPEVIRLTFER